MLNLEVVVDVVVVVVVVVVVPILMTSCFPFELV
jgi:hypothetical protein